MKVRIVTIAIGLSLAISAARGNQILTFVESGAGGVEHLVVTLDGAQLPNVLIEGPVDHWIITLPSGYSISDSLIGGDEEVAEPDQIPGEENHSVNFIRFRA